MIKKRISIFGATGSVGQNTLDLISRDRESYEIVALSAGSNIELLIKAALEFQPEAVVAVSNSDLEQLRYALKDTQIEVGTGRAALLECAARKCDLAFSAIVGAAGLEPGLIALENGADLALANKDFVKNLLSTSVIYPSVSLKPAISAYTISRFSVA